MKLLISNDELSSLRARETVHLECENCKTTFCKPKNNVLSAIKGHPDFALKFCSRKCHYQNQVIRNWVDINCAECGKNVKKQKSKIRNNTFSFCSKSCSTTFQNKNKTSGGLRRSKAEIHLIELIRKDFENLKISENERSVLPSNLELDIYIASIQLAIEINGILHYFPIYGSEKLESIKSKDAQKILDAGKMNCKLIIVNISHLKYWKETKEFLNEEYIQKIKPLIRELIN